VLTFVDDLLYFVTDPNKQLLTESLSLEEGARDYLRYGGLTQEEVAKVEAFVRG